MQLGDYLRLITPFHAHRPKFVNMVAALIAPLVDAQGMLDKLTADFDLDTAVGVQLDQVGQWIGRTRYIMAPVSGKWFAFDDYEGPRVGFDQGIWIGPYDVTDQIAAMDDETYRSVLKMQAIANEWDGTLGSIQDAFNRVFPGVVIDDRGDTPDGLMSMDVLIPGIEMSSLMLAVLEQDFPIKPSGVRVNIIETTVSTEPIFGFDVDNDVIGGLDHGAWGKLIYTR